MKPKYTYKYADGKEYGAILVAADAIVHYQISRTIYLTLLVRRKDNGLFACPGGFVNYEEKTLDAAIRECKEETGVELKAEWAQTVRVFDEPDRGGERGRILSIAYYFIIPPDVRLPQAKAGDDAAEAVWCRGHEMEDMAFHDDHKKMILVGPPYNRYGELEQKRDT